MAFIQFHFFSQSLGMQSEAYVIIPQKRTSGQIGLETKSEGDKYKCLYLLHGLSDDHTAWMRRTSIERYAEKYGICVVMPCVHRSFYLNLSGDRNYYTLVADELPSLVSEFFNISNNKDDNFIAGLSMGGYGALKIAMREKDKFAAAAGLSSVTEMLTPERLEFGQQLLGTVDSISPSDDLFYISEKMIKPEDAPRMFMAVGTDDFVYPENIRFKNHLISHGFDLKFIEAPGDHSWDFWDKYIQIALEWMLENK